MIGWNLFTFLNVRYIVFSADFGKIAIFFENDQYWILNYVFWEKVGSGVEKT